MRVLLALKLTSDSLMVAEAMALRDAPTVTKVCLLTDKDYGTKVEHVHYYFLNPLLARMPLLRLFARIPIMIRICKEQKIDALICYHLTSYGFVGFIVSKLLGIPLSVHFLGKDIDISCRTPYLGPVLLWFARKIDIHTVQGSTSKKFLDSKGFRNVHIMPTGCDLPKPRRSHDEQKKFDLIFLGRLGQEKRVDRFIDIVSLISNRGLPIRAVIVGAGPEEKTMIKRISRLNLQNLIECTGWTNDVAAYLNQSKVYMLTSDSDQLPSSLIEAMALGLVPIASNVGNISDVVDEDVGFLIDKEDKKGFADAAITLLTDQNTYARMSKQSLQRAKGFSVEANSKRWENILRCIQEGNH